MDIKLFFDNQADDIVRWQMPPVWDMHDVHVTNAKAVQLFAEREPQRLYVIVDLSRSQSVPRNFITGVSHVSRESPSNWHFTVIVAPGHALRTLFQVAARADTLIDKKYHLVPTMADAQHLIAHHRQQRSGV